MPQRQAFPRHRLVSRPAKPAPVVSECVPRAGGGFLVFYREGKATLSAISEEPLETGERIVVRSGIAERPVT